MSHLLILSLNNDPTSALGTKHAGGQTKYILELAKSLLFNGWQITIVTIGNNQEYERKEIAPDFDVIKIPLLYKQEYDYDVGMKDVADIAETAADKIVTQHDSYTCILACYWLSGILGGVLQDKLKVPFLFNFCSIGYSKAIATNTNLSERIASEKTTVSQSDLIIAASNSEMNTIIKHYDGCKSKIRIIPYGIDIKVFYP